MYLISQIFMCAPLLEMMEMMKIERAETLDCNDFKACETCTAKSFCNWILDSQMCVNILSPYKFKVNQVLTVANKENCPKYSLASDRLVFANQSNYSYKINVSNDIYGFMDALSETTIECEIVLYQLSGKITTVKGRVDGSLIV